MQAKANGISIEYESFGRESDPPLVLIAGLGSQLVTWEEEFVESFVDEGMRVIVFDNRDVGFSTWFDELGKADYAKAMGGEAPYLLSDMADDVSGLFDSLELDSAHVFGISLGGMIAQSLAIAHPDRVASLALTMSTTGNPTVGNPTPEASQVLLRSSPPERDAYLQVKWESFQVTGISPKFPVEEEHMKARAARAYDRTFHPAGNGRQLCAVLASGDRTDALAKVDAATVVIHGSDDALVNVSGGYAIAEAIPDSRLVVIEGMGHHLPEGAWDQVVGATLSNIARA